MKTFNHAFDFAFSISGSSDPEGNVSGQELRAAIQMKLNQMDDAELIECCGMPFDSYEEFNPASPDTGEPA